jgi:hypothetical protein
LCFPDDADSITFRATSAERFQAVERGFEVIRMPSRAYRQRQHARARELDQLESAHTLLGGTARGRRSTTQQINRAYAVLLASQFQGFARDLHTESADLLVAVIPEPGFRMVVRRDFLWNRQLDSRNANQATVAGDFARLGIPHFWAQVDAVFVNNHLRRQWLDDLNTWRNAIARQTFDPAVLGGSTILHLATVQRWRRGCHKLAQSLDRVLRSYIQSVTGSYPW